MQLNAAFRLLVFDVDSQQSPAHKAIIPGPGPNPGSLAFGFKQNKRRFRGNVPSGKGGGL